MKNLKKYIAYIFVVTLLFSCQKNGFDNGGDKEGEGILSLGITLDSKASGEAGSDLNDPRLSNSTLKIYKKMNGTFGNGGLIFKYSPATTMPKELPIMADDYKLTLDVGTNVAATFDRRELSFYGEKEFTLTPNINNKIDVECAVKNALVEVVFDQTVLDKFDVSKICTVYAANSARDTMVTTPTLRFSDSNVGYFILPEGVDKLQWSFYGVSSTYDYTQPDGAINLSRDGEVVSVQAGYKYTIKFKYSKTPDGTASFNVDVDKTEEIFEDEFTFTVQPRISGDGFSLDDENPYLGDPYSFNIDGANDLSQIEVTVKFDNSTTTKLVPLAGGVVADLSSSGVAFVYNSSSNKSGVLTLQPSFFEKYQYGGIKDVYIKVVDEATAEKTVKTKMAVTGLIKGITDLDLWFNTVSFKAMVVDPAVTSINILYRDKNKSSWESLVATKGGDGLYKATVEPTWSNHKNNYGNGDLDVYQLEDGILADRTYEFKLAIDGVEIPKVQSYTTADGHTIDNGNMESSSLTCWGTGNSSSSDWASGNNGFTRDLCTQGTAVGQEGSKVAVLKGKSTLGVLAAGNLFYGQFVLSGTSGTASFGQSFNWSKRPKTFKFKYSASLGTVDIVRNSSTPLKKGDSDQARVYLAIVDWSERHGVTAGTSGKPTGSWDPVTQNSIAGKGKIIGYASLLITQSTSNNMVEQEIPISYYYKDIKPSEKYTIMISCSTSNYGDFMVGSSKSTISVDDFRLGY